MKLNDSLVTMFLVASTLWSGLAFADKAGNGGGVFICQNRNDSELVDLFEARLSGLKIKTSADPVKTQISAALARFNPASNLYKKMIETLAKVESAKKIPVPVGFDLAWPSDAKNKYSKAGCQAKSAILFNDIDNSMDFDSVAFANLPRTQQAALIVHETVYKFMRDTVKEPDSVRARKVVGHLFSSETKTQFNKAVGEIADFYPMALPRLSAKPTPRQNNGLDLFYPASYVGEPMSLRVEVKLEPTANPACTLNSTHTDASDWDFWPRFDRMSGLESYCRGVSDGQNIIVPACLKNPVTLVPQEIQGRVRVSRYKGSGQKQERIECPARVTVADPFGTSYSMVFKSSAVGSDFEETSLWVMHTFPNR